MAFQKPFELLIRGIAIALRSRYSAFLWRVEELASMLTKEQAVSLFKKEIPAALPLQWHFFQLLQTPDWLPPLTKKQLLVQQA